MDIQAAVAAAAAAAKAAAAAAAAQQHHHVAHHAMNPSMPGPPGSGMAYPGPPPMSVLPETGVHIPGQPYFVKVSGASNPKQVAGKVAHTCRSGDAPAMLTIGTQCINQAVKAVCIARGAFSSGVEGARRRAPPRALTTAHTHNTHTDTQHHYKNPKGYLERDALDLTFQTAFREGATPDKPSVALYLAKHALGWTPTPNLLEMQVSASSTPTVVAGALAAKVREGTVPCLTGIGADAVANCVLAIGHCRLYLEPDGLDIRARPEFIHIIKAGEDLNAIKFSMHVDKI